MKRINEVLRCNKIGCIKTKLVLTQPIFAYWGLLTQSL